MDGEEGMEVEEWRNDVAVTLERGGIKWGVGEKSHEWVYGAWM